MRNYYGTHFAGIEIWTNEASGGGDVAQIAAAGAA